MASSPPDRLPSLGRVGSAALLVAVLAAGTVGAAAHVPDGPPDAVASQDRQANEPPVAVFEFSPAQPEPGETVVLDASASHDVDGEIVTYRWDFDDDGQVDAEGGPNRRIAFPRAGEFTVRLTVVDDDSATNATTRVIEVVGDQPPAAELNVSPTSVRVGEPIALDATGSSDPDGQLVSWAFDTDGDGTFEETFDSPTTLRTNYEEAGTYQVTLRVTDNDGLTDTTRVRVVVEPATPTAGGGTEASPAGQPASPTAGPDQGGGNAPPGGGQLLPGGGLAIGAGAGLLVLVLAGAVLHSRSRSQRPGTGLEDSSTLPVVLAVVLVGLFVGVPAFLIKQRFARTAGAETEVTVALIQLVALALPAVILLVYLLLRFVGQREAKHGHGPVIGPFGPGGFQWVTFAFGFLASVLLTLGLATLLLAGTLPPHLTVAAGLVLGAVSVVPLLMGVVLVSLTYG